ncbi:MAG: hypothetical protein NVS1B10_01180 [Candidatus Saccharimonadales bacterium]
MIKHNQDGAVSGLLISLIMTIIILLAVMGFAVWAFMSRQDYKKNVDSKIKDAVVIAVHSEDQIKDKKFAEDYKKPLKEYEGPGAYASLRISYPKTWSGYVDDAGRNTALVDGYFGPGVVPSISDPNSVFAFRTQVLNQTYAQVIKTLAGQIQNGKLSSEAYSLPLQPDVIGVEVNGELANKKKVKMIILPLRAQTLEIWTEGDQFTEDFNNNILPNFNFSP